MKTNIKSVEPAPSTLNAWGWGVRLLVFLGAFLFVTSVSVFERNEDMGDTAFRVGEPAPRTLFAPFALNYVDVPLTQQRREASVLAVLPVYRLDGDITLKIRGKLKAFLDAVEKRRQVPQAEEGVPPPVPLEDVFPDLAGSSIETFLSTKDFVQIRGELEEVIRSLSEEGLLAYGKKLELLEGQVTRITIAGAGEGGADETLALRDSLSLSEVQEHVLSRLSQETGRDKKLRSAILDLVPAVLEPNLVLDAKETENRRRLASEAVKPVQAQIQKDELIVQRGMIVTSAAKVKVDAIREKRAKREMMGRILGSALIIFLAYVLLATYLLVFERRVFVQMRLLLMVHTIFACTVLFSKILAEWPGSSLILMPASLAPLLLVMLTHSRLGIAATVVMSVLVAPLAGFNTDIILATLLTGFAATFLGYRVRRRLQVLRIGLVIGTVYFLILFSLEILREIPVAEAVRASIPGLANGLIVTAILFPLLAVFENVFNLATDITLLELSDLNHPLLKRMILEAPGTYHHSLVVSRLAESACETIGANELLARVGCYFHDIGKIAQSEYFTENQNQLRGNRHDKMAPGLSSMIIINHVKDGIALARRYKLKDQIIRFIPEHQGTGVVYFFYRKALDQAEPGEHVDPDDYRYPGPKPQSRETAVALLADSTEAASRSLKEPTAENIHKLVRKIINDKFIDGQLDECDLTLRDLHKIQDSFVQNIMAIHHTRVSYPKAEEAEDRPDLFKGGEFHKYRAESSREAK